MISLRVRLFLFTALSVAAAEPAGAALDLKMIGLTNRGGDPAVPIEQVAIVGNRAGFTFPVTTENIGDKYIPWGFPMYEEKTAAPGHTTPWVDSNAGQVIYLPVNVAGMPTVASPRGFSGITEALDTPPTLPMPAVAPGPRLQDDATAKTFVDRTHTSS